MKVKICTKCNKLLPYDSFLKTKNGTYKGLQKYKPSAICIKCIEYYDKNKTCTICNQTLPKTKKYFGKRAEKYFTKSGESIAYSYKSACRTCENEKHAKYAHKRYHENLEESREYSRYKYWKNPEKSRAKTNEWRKKNRHRLLEKDRKRVRELDSSWIASSIGIPLSECPEQLIETKRNIIKIKRELGLTHSTKPKRNTKN